MLSLLASLADAKHEEFLADFFEGRLKKKGSGKPAARPHHHDDDIPSIWGSHPTGSAPHHLFRPCGTEARCWGRDPDSGEKLEPAQTSEAMLEINAAPHDAAQRVADAARRDRRLKPRAVDDLARHVDPERCSETTMK